MISDDGDITGQPRAPFDLLLQASGTADQDGIVRLEAEAKEKPRGPLRPRGLSKHDLVELNGARSNPQPRIELARLGELHHRLLREAAANPQQPRTARPKPSPVLETISLVLELAGQPMQAREIHATAESLTTQRFLWTSVKAALAAGTSGSRPRFERVRHGVYQSARREHH